MIALSWPNKAINFTPIRTYHEGGLKLVLVLSLQKRLVCSKGSSGPKISSAIMSSSEGD